MDLQHKAPARRERRGHGNRMEVRMPDQRTGLCECGCGKPTRIAYRTDAERGWIKGQPMRYLHRHRPPPTHYGSDNHRFNGGLTVTTDGRWFINCRDRTVVAYARGVMAAHIGRIPRTDEIVHHRNGDRSDDRIENLQLTDRTAHAYIHMPDMLAGRGL